MSTERDHHDNGENDEEVQYIGEDDVIAEIDLEGDEPMDDDDDQDMNGTDGQDREMDSTEDTSEQRVSLHQGSVFSISGHPTQPIAASGGEDDLGYLWDITDGEIIARLSGHTDSVTCTAFSSDGEYVSTGGMDGKVRIWRRVGSENFQRWEFLTELQGPDEVMWLRWHPKGTVLLAGSNDSTVWLWQLPSGNTMQVFAGHTGPVQCGEFTPDGKRIVTACGDGTLILWDPRTPSPVFKLSSSDARFDLGGITALGVNPSSSLAVVGGEDGGVRVVSLSKGEVIAALAGHKEGESVEAITFIELVPGDSSGPGIAVTGGTDGKIVFWDLNTMRQRATGEHQDAVTCLLTRPTPKSHIVVSASADRTLRTWDGKTGTLLREHKGHSGPVLGASLGLEGAVVLSGGDDGDCLVFTTLTEAAE
jgi:ribosome assembly protein SQT1